MRQFRVTGIDNRTNKPLQAMIDAADEAEAYKAARKQFATIDRIDRIASAPTALNRGAADSLPSDSLEDEEEDEDDAMPDLSTFDLDAPRLSGGVRGLLRRYQGQRIGINIDDHEKYRVAKLASVNEDMFTVRFENNNFAYHFAIRGIVAVLETSPGNPTPTTASQTPGLIIELPRTTISRALGGAAPKA